MKAAKTKKPTRKELENKIIALEAQAFHTAYFATQDLKSLLKKDFTGSAVIISIKALNGTNIVGPVAIGGGLSRTTIESLIDDTKRSQASLLDFNLNKGA